MSSPESFFKSNYSDCNDRGDCMQTSLDYRKTIAYIGRLLGEREESMKRARLMRPCSNREHSGEIGLR